MSERLKLSNEACRQWLDGMMTTGAAGGYLWVGLFKSSFTASIDCATELADFTTNECVFDGYGRAQAFAHGVAFDVDDCLVQRAFSSVHFQFYAAGEPSDTDEAGGYFVWDYTQTALVGYGIFDAPVPFDDNTCYRDVHFHPCLTDGCGEPA